MLFEIHALMENADDFDVPVRLPVEENVGARPKFPIEGANVIAGASEAHVASQNFACVLNLANVGFGAVAAPNGAAVIPDGRDVALNARA